MRTKEQIKDSPEYDATMISDHGYHGEVESSTAPAGRRTATRPPRLAASEARGVEEPRQRRGSFAS